MAHSRGGRIALALAKAVVEDAKAAPRRQW
jgi:hypothetical protein